MGSPGYEVRFTTSFVPSIGFQGLLDRNIKLIEEEKKKYNEKNTDKVTNHKLAEITGISESEVERISNLANDSNIGSLDDVWFFGNDDDEISVMDTIQSPGEPQSRSTG